MPASKPEDYKIQLIPITDIEIGTEQTRHSHVEERIDELAGSIMKLGLLNPITVFEKDGKFILITGQRRFLAFNLLNEQEPGKWNMIPARILPAPPDEAKAKAMSLSENVMREDLSRADTRDSILRLYTIAGTFKAVSETLGIPVRIVKEYVKYEGLTPELKQMVDARKIDVKDAVKVQSAAMDSQGQVDVEKAKTLASEIGTLFEDQKRRIVEVAETKPEFSAEEVIEEAKKPPKSKRITVTLAWNQWENLRKAADQLAMGEEEAAAHGLVAWLSQQKL